MAYNKFIHFNTTKRPTLNYDVDLMLTFLNGTQKKIKELGNNTSIYFRLYGDVYDIIKIGKYIQTNTIEWKQEKTKDTWK